MTKEQYLHMRSNGDFNIVYEYYKEKFNHSKHTPFLHIQDLANLLLNLGYDVNKILDKCAMHFDQKFSIVRVLDKDGKFIKIL
jgi:hypothetical protein